ncbi:hypothetical protein AK812_SmicGene45621, partial [Symbiodinium microadriaticum]
AALAKGVSAKSLGFMLAASGFHFFMSSPQSTAPK